MSHDQTALLARLRDAKEGSRELGDAVLFAAGWKNVRGNAPDPTTSLDAITREIEAKGWVWFKECSGWTWNKDGTLTHDTCFEIWTKPAEKHFEGEHPDDCLALCYAFVEALSHE
jgi:hypothetical protein